MSEQREALAEALAEHGVGQIVPLGDGGWDVRNVPPEVIDALLDSPALARLLADAEQRGAARGWEEARTELLDALAGACDECHGTGQSVQGWTDKHGYSENQYGPCHACAERAALAAQDPA